MSIYKTKKYRKIWESYYGPIPREKDGRSYEIHHIDGNKNNNLISNLKCVSIQEHYDIHYSQEDWAACCKIASRLNMSHKTISELAKLAQQKLVEDGTHYWLSVEHSQNQSAISKERLENGTHNFIDLQKKRVKEGTHHFIGSDVNNKRVKEGTHPFLGGNVQRESNRRQLQNGTHHSQFRWTCSYCNISGLGKSNYTRYHGNNCKLKS